MSDQLRKIINRMDVMRLAWPDFRHRAGYIKATQDLEAECRRELLMPAPIYGKGPTPLPAHWRPLPTRDLVEAAQRDLIAGDLKIRLRTGSVMASIQAGKSMFAQMMGTGDYYKIKAYRVRGGVPEGQKFNNGEWFPIEGCNVEEETPNV